MLSNPLYSTHILSPTRLERKIDDLNYRLKHAVPPSRYVQPEPDEFFRSLGMPPGREPWEWHSVGMWRPCFENNDRRAREIHAGRDNVGVKHLLVYEKSKHFRDKQLGCWHENDQLEYYTTWEKTIPLVLDASYIYFKDWALYWLEVIETGKDPLREYWQPVHPHLFTTAALLEAEKAVESLELLCKEIRHDGSKRFS